MKSFSLCRALKLLAVNFSILVAGLIVIELIYGDWFGRNRLNKLGIVRNAEITFDVRNLYQTDRPQVLYKRDAYGLRGEYGDPGGIDILTMGGSTTDQRYIHEGFTWQDVLRREFLAHGKNVRIANAGMDGQSSVGLIKDFEWWFPAIPGLKARYVLFYIGINDFYAGHVDISSAYEGSSLKEKIKNNSALWYLLRTIKGIYYAKQLALDHGLATFRDQEWVDAPKINNHEQIMEPSLRAYAARLGILNEKARQFGAVPIFVTQTVRVYKQENGKVLGLQSSPKIYEYQGVDINGVDCYFMMRLQNKRTMEACQELGGICIDLASELQFDDDDFYDLAHNTPKGAEKIGRYLYEKLKDEITVGANAQ